MLAKGHDFPALTLVGVINPDSALYSSDFAQRKNFCATGTSGWPCWAFPTKRGKVLIQTAFPDHPLFCALQAHDFASWADAQLAERRLAGFPPLTFQAMLRAEGKHEADVYQF